MLGWGRSYGALGFSPHGTGVYGLSDDGVGGGGESKRSIGLSGHSVSGLGVYGSSREYHGLYGWSEIGYGLYATSGGKNAAYLDGDVRITGDLGVSGNLGVFGTLQKGGGSFKIDHPLDPANKYLSHSFVESPDMKNVYDGIVVLDHNGEAEVELPDWFSSLNEHFRYQLTTIGAPGPNLFIAEEISSNEVYNSGDNDNNNIVCRSHFKIAGGTSEMKVSWQVTGIRKDPWANVNRIQVEQDKPDNERGFYMYPDLYGRSNEKGITHLLFPKKEGWQEELVKLEDG